MTRERQPGRPARRAITRWGWRLFRREWKQQLLVLSLLTVAVATAIAGSAMAVNAVSVGEGRFGSANAILSVNAHDQATGVAVLAAAQKLYGTTDVIAHAEVTVPGTVVGIDVRAQDPSGAYGHSLLALRSGRYPSGAGEVAVTSNLVSVVGHVGDTVDLGGGPREVVGVVENPGKLSDTFALVAPGTLATTTYSVLVDIANPDRPVPQLAGLDGVEISGSGNVKQAVAATVLAASTLALILVALVASAGFVVVAERRQRNLGLLSALGATGRHVRMVMVVNGALVGVVAALAGLIVGIGGWVASASAIEGAADHRIARFDLPWTLIVATLVIAIILATLSAWWPARSVSRQPVMVALSGRPASPRPVHRSIGLAFAVVAAGFIALGFSKPTTPNVRTALLIAGLIAVVVGSVLASPAAIRVLATLSRRLPFGPRLALRDLSRHQSRAAAALAAITLGIAISVSIVGIAVASQSPNSHPNLSASQLVIHSAEPDRPPDPTLTTTQLTALDEQAASIVASIHGSTRTLALDVAVNTAAGGGAGNRPVEIATPVGQRQYDSVSHGDAYVATDDLLRGLDVDPARVANGADVLRSSALDSSLPLVVLDFSSRPDSSVLPATTQQLDLPPYGSAPSTLLTQALVSAHGWGVARSGWFIQADHALTSAELDAVRAAAAVAGFAVEQENAPDDLSPVRNWATGIGAALALALVAMAVGLIRGESVRDTRTLAATGAEARTRRAITSTTAAALAVSGVVLGVGGASVALVAVFHSRLTRLTPIPVADLLAIGVGLPLIATIAGWLVAGREPRTFSRQMLD
ncbi:MAG: hypothetical protein JWN62_405 [Acidimicrobiales bacterium]|nr:hypothetical protein [Acidimicrobiales bacterium]